MGSLLGRLRRKVRANVSSAVALHGEEIETWLVLKHVIRTGPATQVELSAALAQHPASTSRLLADLEERALVRRTRDEHDQRRQVVEATPSGLKLFDALTPGAVDAIAHVLRGLSAPEQMQLRGLLEKALATD